MVKALRAAKGIPESVKQKLTLNTSVSQAALCYNGFQCRRAGENQVEGMNAGAIHVRREIVNLARRVTGREAKRNPPHRAQVHIKPDRTRLTPRIEKLHFQFRARLRLDAFLKASGLRRPRRLCPTRFNLKPSRALNTKT